MKPLCRVRVVRTIVVVVASSLAACRSGPPPIVEFMLSEATAAAAATSAPTPDARSTKLPIVRVASLIPRAFLDRRGVAWREGDVRSGAYHYRRWSEAPGDAVTRLLVETLRTRGAFEAVDESADQPARRVVVRGELLGLHEQSDEEGEHTLGVAELELVVEVTPAEPNSRGETVGSREPVRTILRSRHEVAAADESTEALVRAIGAALQQVLADVAPQVEKAARG